MRLPNGEWMTSCMPPDSSKKRSSTIGRLRRQRAERRARGGEIVDELLAARGGDADVVARAARPPPAVSHRRVDARDDVVAQPRHRVRQLVGARRRLAQPERNRRRLAVRILDAHAARLDAPDPVRRVAELEDVAGEALDGEVLVDGADELAGGLEHDVVVGVVGNRAAGGERGRAARRGGRAARR